MKTIFPASPMPRMPHQIDELNPHWICGEPWFDMDDVCNFLHLSTGDIGLLDDGEYIFTEDSTYISEPCVIRQAMKSQTPYAQAIRQWLMDDVLFNIFHSGAYFHPNAIGTVEFPHVNSDYDSPCCAACGGNCD